MANLNEIFLTFFEWLQKFQFGSCLIIGKWNFTVFYKLVIESNQITANHKKHKAACTLNNRLVVQFFANKDVCLDDFLNCIYRPIIETRNEKVHFNSANKLTDTSDSHKPNQPILLSARKLFQQEKRRKKTNNMFFITIQ